MISKSIIEKYNRCISISKKLKKTEQKSRNFHTAFIFYKNKLVSIGINRNKSHPKIYDYQYYNKFKNYHPLIHAEHDAILKLDRDIYEDCSIFILRINNNNEVANSRPCVGCQDLLKKFNLKKIYYSNELGKIEKFNFN